MKTELDAIPPNGKPAAYPPWHFVHSAVSSTPAFTHVGALARKRHVVADIPRHLVDFGNIIRLAEDGVCKASTSCQA